MPRIIFLFCIATLIFLYGVAVEKYQIFPHSVITYITESVRTVSNDAGMITKTRPSDHIRLAPPGSGTAVEGGGQTTGYTAVSGFFDDGMKIRLLDGNGEIVHLWSVSFSEIWPDPSHIQPEEMRPKSDWNTYFNGIDVQPDGSIVLAFKGFVKLDSCGKVIWKVPQWLHHSVEASPRGTYWVPGSRYIENGTDHLPFKGTYYEHTVVEVSADGEVLREISIMDVLKENDMLRLLSANNPGFKLNSIIDIIHLNDVEEIPTDLVEQFPQFAAGDLLMSLRDPNLLVIMDPDTRKVKWYQIGPWSQQHDADWQPDGRITVFNNNVDTSKFGSILGGSEILSVDPKTGDVETLYGGTEDQHFYSSIQGDHQVLENGNILITASTAGRVFEVTPAGETVWETINWYKDDKVLLTSDAVRYPAEYLNVSSWSCAVE